MVATEDWAACANFSWLPAAFCTRTLVSSTRTFAVFKIPSLGRSQPGQLPSESPAPSVPLAHSPTCSLWTVPPSPVVSESFSTLTVERASSGKHDGGVEVRNNTRHGTGCCNAGLGSTIPSLERSQHMGDLQVKLRSAQ